MKFTKEQIMAMSADELENTLTEIRSKQTEADADIDNLLEAAGWIEERKAALKADAEKRQQLRSKLAAGAGAVVRTLESHDEGKKPSAIESRANDFVKSNHMSIPMFVEERSVLVSSGKLATPTAVSEQIGELPQVVSSILDHVEVIDATGTGAWEFPYEATAAAAAAVTEGQTIGGTPGTFDYVTVSPSTWGVLDEVSNQVKKMTPVAYANKVQRQAHLALRKKAKEALTAAITGSTLAENLYSYTLDQTFVRKVVLGYDGDESVAGGTKLYINKTDLATLGAVRGTNEKKPVYEISFTDENNGTIRDGATVINFCINSSLETGVQIYGKPQTVKLLLWDNYEISTDDGGDYFKRNMVGIRGIQTAGAGLTVYHGMQVLHQAAS